MGTKKIDIIPAESTIDWTGRKVTGSHNGSISLKKGNLILHEDKLSGGSFTIDTTSIKIIDITDPATNTQFAGHLFSDDFFSTDKFPEAVFTITHTNPEGNNTYLVTGDLTIKGITHATNFTAAIDVMDNVVKATGRILVDRTKYDMRFRSGNFFTNLGDTLIYNEFELIIKLTAFITH